MGMQQAGMGQQLKRRGVIAAAAAFAAGIAASTAGRPVSAATTLSVPGTFFVDAPGSSALTVIATSVTDFSVAIDAEVMAPNGAAVLGTANANNTGIFGSSGNGEIAKFKNVAVGGDNSNAAGIGVSGRAFGTGVLGRIPNTSSATNTVAVQGINQATGTGGIGVSGRSDGNTGVGVQGISGNGIGVSGASNGNAGVFGTTTKSGFSGLAGIVSTPGTAAFAGTATVPTAFAGFFTGDVFVNGNFTVQDPTKKHGAIAHPDGSYRILYSMESPEAWLEDFGEGNLVNGKADVKLDPDFAAVVHTDRYLVFLTSFDAHGEGLAVTARRADGFTVEERKEGTSSQAFGWRMVVKPRTENKAVRLAKFTIPEIKVPQPPPIVTTPTVTAPDSPPQPAPPSRPAPAAVTPSQGSGTTQGSTTSPVQPIPPSRP